MTSVCPRVAAVRVGLIAVGTLLASSWVAAGPGGTDPGADGRVAIQAQSSGRIEEIVVTGTPRAQDTFYSPADVDAISGERKARIQRPNVGASLERLPGVSVLGTGTHVGKPVIRGLSGNRVRVLSNDVALNYQQFGVRHPPNIDPYLNDRIEVIRGPSSVLYGSDAIGGAVNLISAPPPFAEPGTTDVGAAVTGEYASAYDQWTGVVSVRAAVGGFGVTGTLIERDSGGLEVPNEPTALETGDPTDPLVTGDVPFTDFDQHNGDLTLGWQAPWGLATVRYEGFRNEHNFAVPDPPPPDGNPLQAGGIGQDLENDIVQAKLVADVAAGLTLEPSLTWVRNERISNPGPPEPLPRRFLREAAVIDIERRSLIGRVLLRHDPVGELGLSGQLGVEIRREKQQSDGAVMLTPGGEVENYALFAFETVDIGRLTLNAGARYDHIRREADPAETRESSGLPTDPDQLEQEYDVFTGGIGASYRLTDDLVLAANVNTGFRAPTLFDLFVNGVHGGVAAVQFGDPDLDEERALATDLSLRWRGERWRATATIYHYDISDYIFLAGTGETAPGGPIFQVSQDDAELTGGDVEVAVSATPWLELSAIYEAVNGELDDADVNVPLLPADNFLTEATAELGRVGVLEDVYFSVAARWVEDQKSAGLLEPFGQFDAPPPPFGTGSTDSYNRVDLGAGATVGVVTLRLDIENLFDETYRDFQDTYKNITLSPGRNVRLSVDMTL